MKKISLIIAVLIAILGLSQCNKPNISPFDSGRPGQSSDGQYITFTNDSGNGAKLNITEATTGLEFRWCYADQLHVYSCDNENFEGDVVFNGTVTLKDGYADSIQGKFEGFVSMDIKNYVRFYYYGSKISASEDGSTTVYLSDQNGTLESVKEYLVARTGSIPRGDGTSYHGILTVPFSIVKLDLGFFDGGSVYIDECGAHSSPTYKGLTICGTSGAFETKIDDGGTHDYEFKIDNPTSDVYLALLPPTAATYPGVVDVREPENPEDKFMVLRFSDNSTLESETKSVSHIFKLRENRFYTSGIANNDKSTDKGIEITDRVDFGRIGIWAKYNVGAKHLNNHDYINYLEQDTIFNHEIYSWYGDFFAWADKVKKYTGDFMPEPDWINSYGYDWPNYVYSAYGTYDKLTKYVRTGEGLDSEESYRPDGWEGDDLMILQPEDDVAVLYYQSANFITPSYDQWLALMKWVTETMIYENFIWTDDYYYFGIQGWIIYKTKENEKNDEYEITDPHIFLPAAGFFEKTKFIQLDGGRMKGNYMMSNRDANADKFLLVDFNDIASFFHIYSSSYLRSNGVSVRGIMGTTR